MKQIRIAMMGLTAIAAGLLLDPSPARATWPSGARMTIPGYACHSTPQSDGQFIECPFMTDPSHAATDVLGYYIDYYIHLTGSDTCLATGPCHQSWTGAAYQCGMATGTANEGNNHLWGYGFATMGVTNSPWDYWYVGIGMCKDIQLNGLWGVNYGGS